MYLGVPSAWNSKFIKVRATTLNKYAKAIKIKQRLINKQNISNIESSVLSAVVKLPFF